MLSLGNPGSVSPTDPVSRSWVTHKFRIGEDRQEFQTMRKMESMKTVLVPGTDSIEATGPDATTCPFRSMLCLDTHGEDEP